LACDGDVTPKDVKNEGNKERRGSAWETVSSAWEYSYIDITQHLYAALTLVSFDFLFCFHNHGPLYTVSAPVTQSKDAPPTPQNVCV